VFTALRRARENGAVRGNEDAENWPNHYIEKTSSTLFPKAPRYEPWPT
jgi:hypothetical protein